MKKTRYRDKDMGKEKGRDEPVVFGEVFPPYTPVFWSGHANTAQTTLWNPVYSRVDPVYFRVDFRVEPPYFRVDAGHLGG